MQCPSNAAIKIPVSLIRQLHGSCSFQQAWHPLRKAQYFQALQALSWASLLSQPAQYHAHCLTQRLPGPPNSTLSAPAACCSPHTLAPFLDSNISSCTTALKPSHYRYFIPCLVQKPCIYQNPGTFLHCHLQVCCQTSYPLPWPSKGLQKVQRQTQQNTLAMLRSSLYFGRGTVLCFSLKASSRKATIFSSKQKPLVYQSYQMCPSAAALASHCPTADEQWGDATNSGNALSH